MEDVATYAHSCAGTSSTIGCADKRTDASTFMHCRGRRTGLVKGMYDTEGATTRGPMDKHTGLKQ